MLTPKFDARLARQSSRMSNSDFRLLAYRYCCLYQEKYWFEQLVNAFAYLDLRFQGDELDVLAGDLLAIHEEVAYAMAEYFISLNEVAAAVNRLLAEQPFTFDDTRRCVEHVLAAHACNEPPEAFAEREDQILGELLGEIVSAR